MSMSRALRWPLLAAFALTLSCARPPTVEVSTEIPAELVSAHTDGLISRRGTVRVRLTQDFASEAAMAAPLSESPFTFDPPLKGEARWSAANELEFRPEGELEPGQTYKVTVDLRKLLPDRTDAAPFGFEFGVLSQSFWPTWRGLEAEADHPERQRFLGSLKLSDVAEDAAVEAMLVPKHEKDALTVRWTHEPGGLEHSFVIEGITRRPDDTTLTLTLKGDAIGVSKDLDEEIAVSGLNHFVLSSTRAEITGERYIELRFSDPIDETQNLNGLITVAGRDDIRLERDGSVVRIYASAPWASTETVTVQKVKNKAGFALKDASTVSVSFAPVVPSVSFVSQGVILPTTANLTLPIEATNVRAIDIEAIRVYEMNVPQFLQVNSLDGDRELARVGQVVWKQRVEVEASPDRYNRPVHLGLDISKLVAENPTGLYRISMRFRRSDILYDCAEEPAAADVTPKEERWDEPQAEQSWWDMWSGDGEEDAWEAYERRMDPCHRGFYLKTDDHDIEVSKNVIISDLGLLASQGVDGQIHAVATDLRTATPMSDVSLELLDYQLQTIGQASTNTEGLATLNGKTERPFALVARARGQTSWLRLDRGASLQVSHFDVGGAAVSHGLKGYIYGERGVWRPGDDIYLNFVLFDATGKLPTEHPVELELQNPRGQIIERRTVTSSTNGFYNLHTRTPDDAPTGTWLARVRVGGAVFEKSLRVETVMPNRLKIGLDFGTDLLRAPDLKLDSTLESRWLHGAIASALKADVSLALSAAPTSFPKYDGYVFDDPTASFHADPVQIWEGELDETGHAPVKADIEVPDGAPGMLTGTFATRVFEPGGAFSVDQATVRVSPYARYVGLQLPKGDAARGMLLTDTDQTVQLVAVDADGKPAGDAEIDISVRQIRWRWWWEKGEESLADYHGSESQTQVASGHVKLKNGKGSWTFQVHYPSWGRYLVTAKDSDGHQTGQIVYIDWPGWAGRAQKDQPGGASVLSVTADNNKVNVGQRVTLSFPMAKDGRALVSLESGTRVVSSAWVTAPTSGETGQYSFVATGDMAPNIYAHVTLLQPHLSAKNDAPIRLYGIIPIEVSDPDTKLAPVISAADHFEPESTALVSVSESAGRPMTYTLAVVDEGLLGLTRFQTPNPWSTFFAREALGVRTWDLYDSVAGAYGGTLEGLLSIGGDGSGLAGKQKKAQRFKPMVWVEGPFTLAAGATTQHKVQIPQYVGEVRVMVVAGQGRAFGSAEQAVPVKKPLMVLATLPRVLSPGEEVDLPVSVFALDNKVKEVTLKLNADGVTTAGATAQKISFKAPGDQLVSFHLKVGDKPGMAKIAVSAEGGGEKATQTIDIEIRHPGAPVVEVQSGTVAVGKRWEASPALVGVAGTQEAWLELSRTPPMDLSARLDYLIQYPHGCVEQTTSAVFPQIYLSRLMELTPKDAARTEANVKAGISRLRIFQTSRGGFGYWPGDQAQDWASSYAGNFLLEAERAGYLLPAGMRSSWLSYQKDRANRWVKQGNNDDLEQAYRLYTLALAGSPDLGAMNRLKEATLSTTARWRLAAAYALVGQKEAANGLIAKASLDVPAYHELTGTFGSDLRDQALILESLVLLGDSRAEKLALSLSSSLTKRAPYSTQETATLLVSLARYAGVNAVEWSARWTQDGGAPVPFSSTRPMTRIPLVLSPKGTLKLSVENTGSTMVYARIIQRGQLPLGEERPSAEGLTVSVSYKRPNGEDMDLDDLSHGEDLVAVVQVQNTSGRDLDELALTWLAPSGWEISGLAPGPGEDYDYRDVRDDRVYTYFDLKTGLSTTFEIPINASYSGRYYVPPASIEAMYDASLHARGEGRWLDVRALPEG